MSFLPLLGLFYNFLSVVRFFESVPSIFCNRPLHSTQPCSFRPPTSPLGLIFLPGFNRISLYLLKISDSLICATFPRHQSCWFSLSFLWVDLYKFHFLCLLRLPLSQTRPILWSTFSFRKIQNLNIFCS